MFILFPQDNITLDHFYRDHVNDLNKSEFKELCYKTWNEAYNFVTVDLTSNTMNGKYRKNFDEFYIRYR